MSLHLLRLRAFTAVAEHRGFTAAANALGVSQPAISRAIRELERECGFALVERSPRGVYLTRDGAEFLEDARAVVAAARAADETVAKLRGLEGGRLQVGASTTLATYVLPPFVGRFLERHPGVDVRLDTAHTRGVMQMLLEYAVDIALTEAPVSHPRIQSKRWRTDHLVAVASPGHPLSRQRRIPVQALSDELMLLREKESGTGTIVREALREAGVTLARTMEIDGPEAIKQIAASGRGVAIVSRFTIREQMALGRLVELDIAGLRIERPFHRLSIIGRSASPAAVAFERLLDEDETAVEKGPRSRARGPSGDQGRS
jgi:DNA-binding transcriptional LysR family regulator